MGIDGFRVDAACWLYEDPRLVDFSEDPDRPPEAQPDEYRYWDRSPTYNQPKTLELLADMRQFLDVYAIADGRQRFLYKF